MGDRPLFKQTIDDRMRALIRTEFGWSKEDVDALKDKDLAAAIADEAEKRDLYALHASKAPDWIAAGLLTEQEFDDMPRYKVREFARKVKAVEAFAAVERGDSYYLSLSRSTSKRATKTDEKGTEAMTTIDTLKREEQVTVFADMLAVLAAQQAQIEQLRHEVASLKNANLAVFGHQQVIDQLTTVPRDFEGVEVHMTLEEQLTESEEGATAATERLKGSVKDARDAVAGIEGLASLIAGLNISRKVDLDAVNEATRKMSECSRSLMKTRSKGAVVVKFAKVTGGIPLATGSGAVREVVPQVPAVRDVEENGAVGTEVHPRT